MDVHEVHEKLTIAQARQRLVDWAAASPAPDQKSSALPMAGIALVAVAGAAAFVTRRGTSIGRFAKLAVLLRVAKWVVPRLLAKSPRLA